MICVQGLERRFGDVQAVRDLSFTAEDGKITGLLGPNGAGKTTTLRMLYTLLQPDAGRIRIDDVDALAEPAAARAAMGVLPDSRGLYKHLTVRENIDYFGRLHGLAEDVLAGSREALIQSLEMGDIADRRTEGFSQGQRVKTAIARALVHRPQNVVLDEPGNGLDVMTTRALREFLRSLRAQGRCVVFCSHIMQEVAALCDHIVVIAHGTVVAQGSVDELRAQAETENLEDAFVKLIGSGEGLSA